MNPDPAIPPKPRLPDLIAARELGPAATVEVRWQQLLLVWRWSRARHEVLHPDIPFPDIVSLIEAAGAEPRLRRFYPFTSHFTLCLSSRTNYPWSFLAPAVEPLRDGRFRVRARPEGSDRGSVEAGVVNTAEAAVALAVDNLPVALGPAVVAPEAAGAGLGPDGVGEFLGKRRRFR
ncbi:DUF6193 family natural product biosynthesis protein [Streptomyces shenzhenensis]|uniref:DUF6193 family natural product biosynthesis protein n=1 Tax=Streptomyces shenzhenensis TaxID=943815 RepID=UPI00215D9E97|nr:DUF6193 family natural product biosynthesis protein [Streptomyces shenzhenensis]